MSNNITVYQNLPSSITHETDTQTYLSLQDTTNNNLNFEILIFQQNGINKIYIENNGFILKIQREHPHSDQLYEKQLPTKLTHILELFQCTFTIEKNQSEIANIRLNN